MFQNSSCLEKMQGWLVREDLRLVGFIGQLAEWSFQRFFNFFASETFSVKIQEKTSEGLFWENVMS